MEIDSPAAALVGDKYVPAVSGTASVKNGVTTLSLVNTDLDKTVEISVKLNGVAAKKISGEILSAANIQDYNDVGQPEKVTIKNFDSKNYKVKDGVLTVTMPAKSILTLSLN